MRLIGLAVVLTLSLTLAPLAGEAQQTAGASRVGLLFPASADTDAPYVAAFRQGLREAGYTDGTNIALEVRRADGTRDRLPDLASALVRLKVDVIVAGSTPGALAAKKATSTIPIVMVITGDPVARGLAANLARPGGNLTGVTTLSKELSAKQLEVLKETVPTVTRVAILVNPTNPDTGPAVKNLESTARALGLQHQVLEVRHPSEFDRAFAAMRKERAGALFVLGDPMFNTHRARITGLAAESRLPSMYGNREFVDMGGLMFYGAPLSAMWHRAATYVDKILKGAHPGELPIEQPTKFEMVVNLKTAKALGLTIPQSILVRADEVIQ